jgi:hypothetical protein
MFSRHKIFSCTLHNFDQAHIVTLLCSLRSVVTLLGTFVKLRKGTISFVMVVRLSACPPVRMEQLDSHWTDFHEILYLSILRPYVENIRVKLRKI